MLKWLKTLLRDKLREILENTMPFPQVAKIQDILDGLNKPYMPETPWAEVDQYLSLVVTKVGDGKIETDLGDVLIAKCFLNHKTGEVKTYLAKALDIPAADKKILG